MYDMLSLKFRCQFGKCRFSSKVEASLRKGSFRDSLEHRPSSVAEVVLGVTIAAGVVVVVLAVTVAVAVAQAVAVAAAVAVAGPVAAAVAE